MNFLPKPFQSVLLSGVAAFACFACLDDAQAGPFNSPVNLGATINSSVVDDQPVISRDGLRLFFTSDRPGGLGGRDIWLSERANINSSFAAPFNLGAAINQGAEDDAGTESSDGLRLYLNRVDKFYVATRASTGVSWASPTVTLSTAQFANITGQDFHPAVSTDELTLVYQLNNAGSASTSALMLSTRANVSDAWGVPVPLSNLIVFNFRNVHPSFSSDDLALYFASNRPGGDGDADIYRALRSSTAVAWTSASVALEHLSDPNINTSSRETGPFVFGEKLFFSSDRLGTFGAVDLYSAVPEPGSAVLLAIGGLAAGLFVIRRKKRVASCGRNRSA